MCHQSNIYCRSISLLIERVSLFYSISNYYQISSVFLIFYEKRHIAQKVGVCFVFYDNFMLLCEKNQIRPYTALKNIGIESKSILSRWRAGATPRYTTVKMIAEYFGVTPEELLFGIKKEPSIPTDEELDKSDAMWELREAVLRSCPDLSLQQVSNIMNYIEFQIMQNEKDD